MPALYNNGVVAPQKKARTSFVFKCLNLSIFDCADNILNLSRAVLSVEENFSVLSREYDKIRLNSWIVSVMPKLSVMLDAYS